MERPIVGLAEWVCPDEKKEKKRIKTALEHAKKLGVNHLRFNLSWASAIQQIHTSPGDKPEWYDWFIPYAKKAGFQLLPNILYTPPAYGVVKASAAPPREECWPYFFYFMEEHVCSRWGEYFDYVELWNEPHTRAYWMYEYDHGWKVFRHLMSKAADILHRHNKYVVFGSMIPAHVDWFLAMKWDYLLHKTDILSIHGFPGTWQFWDAPKTQTEHYWKGWRAHIDEIREWLRRIGTSADIWITEVGASTISDSTQVAVLAEAVCQARTAGVGRVYWYAIDDFAPDRLTMQELHEGVRSEHSYHMGILSTRRKNGGVKTKPLFNLWKNDGLDRFYHQEISSLKQCS